MRILLYRLMSVLWGWTPMGYELSALADISVKLDEIIKQLEKLNKTKK